ncbi:MAG: hypothetical protein K8F91_18085 [Candidatus Obscuribacterales bacterium]|nr:hypothetical protein [Candidatus Obscuribacterales bacterium]
MTKQHKKNNSNSTISRLCELLYIDVNIRSNFRHSLTVNPTEVAQEATPLTIADRTNDAAESVATREGTEGSDRLQIAEKAHEKLTPKDGDHLTLIQLLNDYRTPFIDAYERSKQLKDGEPGKSKTLEEV